jgi:hypothetical protein
MSNNITQKAKEALEEILADVSNIRTLDRKGVTYYMLDDIREYESELFKYLYDNGEYEAVTLRRVNTKEEFPSTVISENELGAIYDEIQEQDDSVEFVDGNSATDKTVTFVDKTVDSQGNDIPADVNDQDKDHEVSAPRKATAEQIALGRPASLSEVEAYYKGNTSSLLSGDVDVIIFVDDTLPSVSVEPTDDLTPEEIKEKILELVTNYVYQPRNACGGRRSLVTEGCYMLYVATIVENEIKEDADDTLRELFNLPSEVKKTDWLFNRGYGDSLLNTANRLFNIDHQNS